MPYAPHILAGMYGRHVTTPVLVQSAGALNFNGNITVNLGSTPTVGDTLLFIAIWSGLALTTTPLPSGVTVTASTPSYGTGASTGCNLGTRIVQAGDGKAWVFPSAAWPYPYNVGGYGWNVGAVIEIQGTSAVYSWTPAAFPTLAAYAYGTLYWANVSYPSPAYYIITTEWYFNGGFSNPSWTPSSFGGLTSLFTALPNESGIGGKATPNGLCYAQSLASEVGQIQTYIRNNSGGTSTYGQGMFVISK